MQKIGIICAMPQELEAVYKLITDIKEVKKGVRTFFVGRYKQKEVILTQCQIGKVNAAVTTTLLIENFKPDLIINCGVAGGYSKKLQTLDVVIADKVFYFDVNCAFADELAFGQVQGQELFYHCSNKLIELLKKEKIDIKHYSGSIMTSDQLITDRDYLDRVINEHFKGEDVYAVDMESAAIAQVCSLYHTELIIVRSISDVVGMKQEQTYPNFLARACHNASCVISFLLEKMN